MIIPELKPKLNLIVSKNGVIRLNEDVNAHSFVRNWYVKLAQQACFINARSAMNFNIVSTSNISYSTDSGCRGQLGSVPTNSEAGAGVTNFGLLVGSSDTAWAFTQYALSSLIAHGNSAGQLGYAAQATTVKNDVGATRTTTLTRVFNNNSGGDVTVREIGWATCGFVTNWNYYFMFFREVLAVPVVLVNTEQLTVNFAIDLVYPETIS